MVDQRRKGDLHTGLEPNLSNRQDFSLCLAVAIVSSGQGHGPVVAHSVRKVAISISCIKLVSNLYRLYQIGIKFVSIVSNLYQIVNIGHNDNDNKSLSNNLPLCQCLDWYKIPGDTFDTKE